MYMIEDDWLSVCCTAPPLFDLHHDEGLDTIGICSQCRDHTTFIDYEEE